MTTTAMPGAYLAALAALPRVPPDTLLQGRPLVVVAPHPDDESLGLGGLLAAAQKLGGGVSVIFLTDGEGSHIGSPTFTPDRLAAVRREEARAALAVLGIPAACAHFFSLGDTRLRALPDAERESAQRRLRALVPAKALVCVTAPTDPHGDHQAASALVCSMAWDEGITVMHYPVWTWAAPPGTLPADAPRGFRIDIARELPRKRLAVAAHRSQHGGMIDDAVEAFTLSPEFLDMLLRPTETLTWPT